VRSTSNLSTREHAVQQAPESPCCAYFLKRYCLAVVRAGRACQTTDLISITIVTMNRLTQATLPRPSLILEDADLPSSPSSLLLFGSLLHLVPLALRGRHKSWV
jgi:hypothetical protein